jgi:hypothetical protein
MPKLSAYQFEFTAFPKTNSFPTHHLPILTVDYSDPHAICEAKGSLFVPTSDKQLAANRANALKSTGPRTPEGKARSCQNARTHGFTASTFAVVRLEDLNEIANLRTDLIATYQPVNSQELFAIELIALAQQTRFRAARLESGVFTNCLDMALNHDGTPFSPLPQALVGDIEITRAQNRNYALADGFDRMARKSNSFSLFLRYKAQAELQYRRAIEEFGRLKAIRPELPKEAIFEVQPEENEPDSTPPEEPVSPQAPEGEAPSVSEGASAPGTVPEAGVVHRRPGSEPVARMERRCNPRLRALPRWTFPSEDKRELRQSARGGWLSSPLQTNPPFRPPNRKVGDRGPQR